MLRLDLNKMLEIRPKTKGQLISKGLFGILEFLKKKEGTNSFLILLGKK